MTQQVLLQLYCVIPKLRCKLRLKYSSWSYENLESHDTGHGGVSWVRYLAWNGKRLVVGEGLDDDPEDHVIRPVLECSTSIRILAASRLDGLLETIKDDFSKTAKDIQRIVGGGNEKA